MSWFKTDLLRRISDKLLAGETVSREVFRAFHADSSLSNLPQNLTINGQTVAPTFLYKGKNATVTDWVATVGPNLSIVDDSGNAPTVDAGTPLTDDTDKAVDYAANPNGDYYASANGAASWGTQDGVFSALIQMSGSTNARVIYNKNATVGYRVYVTVSDQIIIELDGVSGPKYVATGVLTAGAWYFAELYVDRSGSGQWYVNGVASGNAADVAGNGSMAAADAPLLVGSDGLNNWNSCMAYAGLWLFDDWLDTHLQADLAKERFTRLSGGFYPQLAKGTAVPTVASRNSTAYLDINRAGVVELHEVGANWMRLCRRRSLDVVPKLLTGYLAEEARTGLDMDSEDFTAWTELDAGDTTAADSIIADTTDGPHGWTHTATLTAVAHTLSVEAKAGKGWLYLSDDTVANADAYFNLATGAIGTVGAAATARVSEPKGSGYYRYEITFTGTVALHTLRVAAAEADGDASFAGDGVAVALYARYAQLEAGAFSTSYIKTSGAAATRVKDELQYAGGANLGSEDPTALTVYCEVLVQDSNDAGGYVWQISDGGSAADSIYMTVEATTGYARVRSAATAGNAGDVLGTVDVADGKVHQLKATIEANSLKLYVDEVADGPEDTSVTLPDGLDEIDEGNSSAAVGQINGLVSYVRIFKKVT